jgi:phospholipid N-methyltransferase
MMNATYSPEDNKLRLYSLHRLDPELYARVKAAGFIYAPKQELFVAPAWTPAREDLLIELCGEIDDEDTSLVDRAEQRAERFETYSEHRANDADRASKTVEAITEHIPLGQPILIGHHSERHARKDAQRIEKGMERAVKMWEQSKYWESRAKGAIRAAKYKELPRVRARRIKGLEADKRKQERNKADAEKWLKLWNNVLTDTNIKKKDGTPTTALERAQYLANYSHLPMMQSKHGFWYAWDVLKPDGERYQDCPSMTVEEVRNKALESYPKSIAYANRWINHLDNRLTYEKTMLDEQGASDLIKPMARPEQLPLCNYRAPEGITLEDVYNRGTLVTYPQVEMTKEEYTKIYSDWKGTRIIENSHRIRIALIRKPGKEHYQRDRVCVFLTNSKTHQKPEPIKVKPVERPIRPTPTYTQQPEPDEKEKAMQAIKETLKEGIKVIVAPQLFPTPPEIAIKMVNHAGLMAGQRILEPSAGTGNLIKAIVNNATGFECCNVVAVENNYELAENLKIMRSKFVGANEYNFNIINADFLSCNGDLGKFDKIIMNPPFENAVDIKHINHAFDMLKPGGRLVALCANGPRQQEAFKNRADHWEVLEPGSFKEQGTNVNVALLVINKAKEAKPITTTKPIQETLF